MKKQVRRYTSPLRQARVRRTRERLLRAVARWMLRRPDEELKLAGVARLAGVERRTLFRHFATKADLLAAFWSWANRRVAPAGMPGTWPEIAAAPRTMFAAFDAEEGLIRASLHSRTGREMRLAHVPNRRRAMAAASAAASIAEPERRRLECVAHVLCSAAAWETMRDYAEVDGREAGEAAAWALGVLAAAAGAPAVRSGARRPSP